MPRYEERAIFGSPIHRVPDSTKAQMQPAIIPRVSSAKPNPMDCDISSSKCQEVEGDRRMHGPLALQLLLCNK